MHVYVGQQFQEAVYLKRLLYFNLLIIVVVFSYVNGHQLI